MPEIVANNETPNYDNNPSLIEAIEEMRKNFNQETQNKVINIALRCTYLVPAKVEKATELVADDDNHVNFENKQKAKFILINNNKTKDNYFPAFTSTDELSKLDTDEKYQAFAMKFADLAGLTETTGEVAGFVINPYHENLPFTQDMLASIKQTLMKISEERAKAAAESAGEDKPITQSK